MNYNIRTRSNMIIAALALCLLPAAVLARSTDLSLLQGVLPEVMGRLAAPALEGTGKITGIGKAQ